MKKKPKNPRAPGAADDFEANFLALSNQLGGMSEFDRDRFMAGIDSIVEDQLSAREVLCEHELDARGVKASITRDYLTQGTSTGVEVAYIDNGLMEIAVLPTRGMGIWKVAHRGLNAELGWSSPVRSPVHPSFINLESRNGLGWLDGFNELVCRCGLSSNGPPGHDAGAKSAVESALTLHGRIANIPADKIEAKLMGLPGADPASGGAVKGLAIAGTVEESTMFGPQLRMRSIVVTPLKSSDFVITDEIENTGSTATDLQLLYHINIGPPFLEAGGSVLVPAAAVVPRDDRAADGIDDWSTYRGPTPGYTEQAYYFEPLASEDGEAVVLLRSARGDRGVVLRFDVATLPKFVVWKCTQPEADGYVTGLEPATNFPNFKSYEREQGRVKSLEPGEKFQTSVMITILTTAREVAAVEEEIKTIQGDLPPIIHRTPQPGWSPAGEAAT